MLNDQRDPKVFMATYNHRPDDTGEFIMVCIIVCLFDKLYHIMLYTSPRSRFELTTSVVIGIDCIGSCKSNYHTITATTVTVLLYILLIYITLFINDLYTFMSDCMNLFSL